MWLTGQFRTLLHISTGSHVSGRRAVNVLPADIVSAIVSFCSARRAGKSTGNIMNVDGGVALAYPR